MKIAITRLKEKAGHDTALCRTYGHDCFTVSPLRAEVYEDRVAEFISRANREEFDCIFFTSALPAQIIAPLLERWPRVIAIGPQTAKTLEGAGITTETLPNFYSKAFAPYLGSWLKDKAVGIPRADVPNPALMESVRAAGGRPHEVPVYALVATGKTLDTKDADAIIFTSAGSFTKAILTPAEGVLMVAIGKTTAARMREGGVVPDITGDGSLEGTLRAINRFQK